MGDVAGWQVPLRFSGPDTEVDACKKHVGMAEQSHVTKLRLQGPGVPAALEKLGATPPVGGVADVLFTSERSRLDIELARLAEVEAWITAPPEIQSKLRSASGGLIDNGAVFDLTSSFSAVRLVGPKAALVVTSLTDLDLRPTHMPDRSCAQTTLAEVYGLVIRADIGDLPSYRLFFGREYGIYVWESLVEAGEGYGMDLIGTEALAALVAAG